MTVAVESEGRKFLESTPLVSRIIESYFEYYDNNSNRRGDLSDRGWEDLDCLVIDLESLKENNETILISVDDWFSETEIRIASFDDEKLKELAKSQDELAKELGYLLYGDIFEFLKNMRDEQQEMISV